MCRAGDKVQIHRVQIFPRWNRVADWLREAERFSTAAQVRIQPFQPQ
jgi:hypothetical protein